MRLQLNRLPADTGKGLAGAHIDRSRPLSFTLNGRQVQGFAGDTVLSALLASGIDTLGTHAGQPIGLRAGAAPAIAYRNTGTGDPQALPMERTPAANGADYVLVAEHAPAGFFARLFQPGRTLGLSLDQHGKSLVRPWRSLHGELQGQTELIVIGGGVAGMAAALAGANAGLAVTLIEASPRLGGTSGLFGTQDGESTPQENVDALTAEISLTDRITVLTQTEVFSITEGLVRAHQVQPLEGISQGRVIDLPTRFIVLANGALERLPVLSGNRLPGVTGALEAYELAYRYGIWPGRSWLIATSTNPAYRLGTILAETGITLDRILDSRDHASSRYIEFCKAYGIRQFPGTTPQAVVGQRSGGRLAVALPHGDTVGVDRLVLCGGWQPDLSLWHIAGGRSRWNGKHQRLEPTGAVPGLILAGSAAGHFTRRGCVTSGIDAVDRLLGRPGRGVEDPVIDALYETPDGMMSAPDPEEPVAPAYLDADEALLMRPAAPRKHWSRFLRPGRPAPVRVLSEAPQPLSIGAISAGVSLGLIPPESAGIVAQERVALVPLARSEPDTAPVQELPEVPAYLADRFGPDARVVTLAHDASRQVGSGALIFANEDVVDARLAVGVVLRAVEGKTRALIAEEIATAAKPIIIRDLGQAFPAEIAVEA
jgi:sarcosine oxidase subunit alpha